MYGEAMRHACDVCAELDVLLSFAEASRAYDYRRPKMVDESIIDIIGGRYVTVASRIAQLMVGLPKAPSARAGSRHLRAQFCSSPWWCWNGLGSCWV